MSDPSNPTTGPHIQELHGIHEFDVKIPFSRTVRGDQQEMHIVVRIPADEELSAYQLASHIATHIQHNQVSGGSPWVPVLPDMTAVNADDAPSPFTLAAELVHYKRIVAALARKMPGLLQVTAEEYETADPDDIIPAQNGDAVVFLSSAAFTPPPEQLFATAPAGEPAAGMQAPGFDPVIEPLHHHDVLPDNPGGNADPDARRVAASTLARALPNQVEILIDGSWRYLEKAEIDHQQANVRVYAAGMTPEPVPAAGKFIARPATVEGYATDLPAASVTGQQVLTSYGWMNVETAENMGPTAGSAFRVTLVGESGGTNTSYNAADVVLLRRPRPEWWS